MDKKMRSKVKIDTDYLSALSRLTIDPDEAKKLKSDLEKTIDFIRNLQQLPPTKQKPKEKIENIFFQDGEENPLNLTYKDLEKNSRKFRNGVFVVGKII